MAFESHHYAFYVADAEFDAILQRVKASGLSFGSAPWSIDGGKLNDWNGGRGFYLKNPDGHILELMTVPQEVASWFHPLLKRREMKSPQPRDCNKPARVTYLS